MALDVVTLTTDGHVFVSASDEAVVRFVSRSEGEGRGLLAQLADGGELLDLLALGDEVDDDVEGAAEEGAT
jgi:hypothetical protein